MVILLERGQRVDEGRRPLPHPRDDVLDAVGDVDVPAFALVLQVLARIAQRVLEGWKENRY